MRIGKNTTTKTLVHVLHMPTDVNLIVQMCCSAIQFFHSITGLFFFFSDKYGSCLECFLLRELIASFN